MSYEMYEEQKNFACSSVDCGGDVLRKKNYVARIHFVTILKVRLLAPRPCNSYVVVCLVRYWVSFDVVRVHFSRSTSWRRVISEKLISPSITDVVAGSCVSVACRFETVGPRRMTNRTFLVEHFVLFNFDLKHF